jgi:hypothetical protein
MFCRWTFESWQIALSAIIEGGLILWALVQLCFFALRNKSESDAGSTEATEANDSRIALLQDPLSSQIAAISNGGPK